MFWVLIAVVAVLYCPIILASCGFILTLLCTGDFVSACLAGILGSLVGAYIYKKLVKVTRSDNE